MAISEEDDKYEKFNQEFHELIAKRIDMDEQVSRELDEKGIKPELDGEEDYYKANKEWFNQEFEKLRKKYGLNRKYDPPNLEGRSTASSQTREGKFNELIPELESLFHVDTPDFANHLLLGR